MEEEFDLIKGVWEEGHQTSPNLKSVKGTAKSQKIKSMNLIEKIINKTKFEWAISWTVVLSIAVYVIVKKDNWVIVSISIIPFVLYFIDYLLKLKKVRSFDTMDTLAYLKNVRDYIYKSYQQQLKLLIYFIMPYSLIFGYFFGLSLGLESNGKDLSVLLEWNSKTQLTIGVSIVILSVMILLLKRYLPQLVGFRINKMYGKEIQGISNMIEDLES
ncbi:hypothetical protein [Flammeovirga sp. SJP92]|uniref:hypothetical protein n=1 Tax=Flammeovirga sp. SJP92 TaxID=1775430 RepID=UPI0007882947|nr:hypothetical protein [Flammeovirga sp. SJP92]KXX68025.1 hypothetical protein AVL50_24555 [Flammeovirga sp. SJP92]